MEQRAVDLGRVFANLKRENPDIHVLSHQWIYDCQEKKRRLDIEGYEITRQPLPPAKKGTRTAFTPEDDMKLVKVLAKHSKAKGRLGHSLYDEVEKHLPNHTASSWRQRYKTNQARLDQMIAKYEAIVQRRRDDHEDPYSDSEDESASYTAISGRGGWPSRSKAIDKNKAKATDSSQRLQPIPSTADSESRRFERSAIKAPRPDPSTSQSTRPFRLDLNGPGKKITFSDDEEDSDVLVIPSKGTNEQSQISRRPLSPDKTVSRSQVGSSTRNGSRTKRGTPPSEDNELLPSSKSVKAGRDLDVYAVPSSPPAIPRAVQHAEPAPLLSASHRRLTSRPLAPILTQDTWTEAHLNTLLSQEQYDDLVYVCTGNVNLALQVATILYQSQLHGWNEERLKQATALRKLMWSPEEDASLMSGQVSNKLLQRHGEEAVRSRAAFLDEQYQNMTTQEKSRRRFPYDEAVTT